MHRHGMGMGQGLGRSRGKGPTTKHFRRLGLRHITARYIYLTLVTISFVKICIVFDFQLEF